MDELPDQEFVTTLRTAVVAYLEAVDSWEAAYRQYYRMPGQELVVSSDMESQQREYEARRGALSLLLPRARRLCLKYHVRNPFPSLLRTSLGRHAPQHRTESAVGRNERNAVADCLVHLADACSGQAPEGVPPDPDTKAEPASTERVGSFGNRRAILVGGVFGVLAAIGIVIATRPAPSGPAQPFIASSHELTSPGGQPEAAATVPAATAAPAGLSPTNHFYRMTGRSLTRWGDYGDILQHGMTAHLGRARNLLSLERTGPYMPPITFPGIGDVVLNVAGRKLLEASGLTGFTFQPVNKTRIVYLPWQDWDLKANKPREYPESGEPEDYILERPSNAHVAEEMGDIWELVVPVTAKIGRPREMVNSFRELYVERGSWNGADVFRGAGYGGPLVTERAKAWMEKYFGEYARFDAFATR
ncbi:MAG TPA: hypothetical protein VKU19_29415 [Bryobacteraceae bacterium]|nr:hypothetical protein [Bryobacteraceae bacterium]